MSSYCAFFGFKAEPFSSEISAKNLLKLPSMVSVKERFDYVMNGGVLLVTGEVGSGRSTVLKSFKSTIREIATTKKQKIAIIVDEAHLLRLEVFAELHTIGQFDNDSKNLFSLVLAGQPNLLEKLTYRSSAPLASRVIARTHLSHLNQDQMSVYLEHHLGVCGVKKQLFSDQAITAIYQGAAGILRKSNLLARGGLIAAAMEKEQVVSADHIRIASTELI